MNWSVPVSYPSVEFINIVSINPLISKCQIKVCYVQQDPNRNGSVITKDVAKKIAQSLPGSPIVGFYNDGSQDFEGHNRIIDISNGEFKIVDTTRPYGFVDINAKVWFQKFIDNGKDEREYLVTEGWLWTGQYPECKRILEKGNNQSMELDDKTLDGYWTTSNNEDPQFFIINEAIIYNLCILGDDTEPCFEGANITAPDPNIKFSFGDNFNKQVLEMMNELKNLLQEGGENVAKQYELEMDSPIFTVAYEKYSDTIVSFQEENDEIFVVYKDENKYYKNALVKNEDGTYSLAETVEEIDYDAEPQFSASDFTDYASKKKKKDEEEEKPEEETPEEEKEETPEEEEEKEKKGKKKKYDLDEIQEYVELKEQYSSLNEDFKKLQSDFNSLNDEIKDLRDFKLKAERAEKKKLIDSFYMLSDEDKKNVIENIDTYSLRDIKAELSIICVDNKVSFNTEEDNPATTFNLNTGEIDDTPAWVKAVRAVANSL